MKKIYFLMIGLLFCCMVNGTNYYVDAVNGNNGFSGLSTAQAKATIQAAANLTNPGDTVFIMNGTYASTGNVLTINRSGNATAQIVYSNYPGHFPKLQASATTYAVIGISAGTSYITVNGLEISGHGVNLSLAADTTPAKNQLVCPTTGSPATSQTPLQKYNGHGITCDSRSVTIGSHHLVITNNISHDNGASGISFLNCDYITVEGNTTYNNSWYTIYGTSGISFNQSYNYDNNTTTYRNIVRNNKSYGNRMYVPFYNDCKVTDGNGIILDIAKVDYNGRSLVANNILFNNGGSAIHAFSMNNVDIFNNVSYLNSASPEINSSNIYALQANNIRIINNIIVARPGKKMNGVNGTTNLVYDYNIFYGGTGYELVGAHSIMQDPNFVNASIDPALADFRLKPGSLGINAGDNNNTYAFDFSGMPRPFGSTVDIGAYESLDTGRAACTGNDAAVIVSNGNGNGIGDGSAGYLYAMADTRASVNNIKSRKAIMYPATVLGAMPANTYITSLKFRRGLYITGSTTVLNTQALPANGGFRIYLRNEASDNLGAGAFDWNTILPGAANPATLVYGGDAASIVGNSGGWKEISFQVPFQYTGANLAVYVEYIQNGTVAGAPDINWVYDNAGSQPLYNVTNYPNQANGFKATGANGNNAVGSSLSSSNERRPVVTIGYCANGTLPVKLLHFYGVKQNNGVSLNWLVSNEINNAGFEIQRSKDGLNFQQIGWVQSKPGANTSGLNEYGFTDNNYLSGVSYYRLLQKDKDGKATHSKIVTIAATPRQLSIISTYPNPATDKLSLLVSAAELNETVMINVQDMGGRVITAIQKKLNPGFNTIEINLSSLAASTYIIVMQTASGEKLIQKFVKK